MKNNSENVSHRILEIAENIMKRGFVRYNPKDEIMSFCLRDYRPKKGIVIRGGVVRRLRLDFKNEKFIDVDNKCDVTIQNCGYLLAVKKMYLFTGIPMHWKRTDKSCTCKTRYVIHAAILDDLFDPSQWKIIRQCKIKENNIWKIVPHDIPLNVYIPYDVKNNTIREMYSVYGVPPSVLADLFKLSIRRIQEIVQDLKLQYKKVKVSGNLKKVSREWHED